VGDLRIKDLVVEYSSDRYAVRPIDGLDLDVTGGSLVILLGPSGCGNPADRYLRICAGHICSAPRRLC
jgi:putative ABC transport system ATP-binding protein